MKIALIRYHDKGNINTRLPESLNKRQGTLPPLGISYLASFLKSKGHDVRIIDAIALNLTKDEVEKAIRDFSPMVVGVTAMTPTLKGALEALRLAKESGATTVIGGPHLAIYPEETLSYDFIDYGIIGEGEEAFADLLKALEDKADASGVRGLIYKKDGRVFANPAAIVEDLDSLPFPARELLPNEKYSSIIGLNPVTTIITTRGCPYHCAFCAKQPSDKSYRVRSPRNVVDEMEYVVKRYGVREIMFYDDTFFTKRSHAIGVCEEILRRNLKVRWETPARINEVDKEILALAKRAGCLRLRYGVESGDPEILKAMNKGITILQIKNVFKLTHEAGIEAFGYFMVGYLHDTSQSMRRTLDFAKRLDADLVMFTITVPQPKTDLYDEVRAEGIVKRDYWRDFTLGKQVGRFSYLAPDAEKWLKRCYWEFYFRPSFIIKSLSKIRTFDDARRHFNAFLGLTKL